MRKKVLLPLMILLILVTVPASAAGTKQIKIAQCVDTFVHEILDQARSQGPAENAALYKAAVKRIYKGSLTKQQKAVIAAENTASFKILSGYDFVEKTSLSKVKATYKNLFGTSVKTLSLPKVSSPGQEEKYVMDYAVKGKAVYRLTYDSHSDMDVKQVSVKKSGSSYIVTRKYVYYSHWGRKTNGYGPTVTMTAKITLKKCKQSKYGFKITALTLK